MIEKLKNLLSQTEIYQDNSMKHGE